MVFKRLALIALLIFNVLSAEWVSPHALSYTGLSPDIAADPSGNAIAVWQDFDAQNNSVIMSSYFNGNTYLWGAPERVSDLGQSSEDAPKVKMGTGGFGIAAFRETTLPALLINTYNNGKWGFSHPIFDEGRLSVPQVILNNNNKGIIAFVSSHNGVQAIVFKKDALSPVKVLDPAVTQENTEMRLAMNDAGNGVLFWRSQGGSLYCSLLKDHEWSPIQKVSNEACVEGYDVGIDDKGQVYLVYERGLEIKFKMYDGRSWNRSIRLTDPGHVGSDPKIAVDGKGSFLVVWKKQGSTLVSSYYDGKDWKKDKLGAIKYGSDYQIIDDKAENKLVSITSEGDHSNAFYRHGLGWKAPSPVHSFASSLKKTATALSATNHTSFAVWEVEDGLFASFSPLAVPPHPPTLKVDVRKDRHPAQTDRIHYLKWEETKDPTAVLYRIKKGHQVIHEAKPVGTNKLELHNRDGKMTNYSIHSVNALGIEGVPTTVSIK